MTSHLLAITVGPVQEFIAAARRTRDLWFGSYLLSEISKATAKSVRDHGGTLIFPAPHNDADLEPDSLLSVANVVVAALNDDPGVVARAAKDAASSRWRSFAEPVFRDHQRVIRADIWVDQVDDVIEFCSAWRIYDPMTYQADRAALMRLLIARKRCRDFLPAKGRAGVPKSSLDGLRESALRAPADWPERSRRTLRVRRGEQLDVVGLVKRTWVPESGAPRYPSVARVAADPWLRGIEASRLEVLVKACHDLGPNVLHRIDTSEDRGNPRYAAFPFEGTAVFQSRHHDLLEEAELSKEDLQPLTRALADLRKDFGEPNPYLGVLVADGDRMGQALASLESDDDHRKFSQALSSFASEARQIVEQHNGVLVYAGGDDVLAFVPVDRCLPCSRALRDAFTTGLATWSTRTNTQLTLSVGVAIAHFMEPLEDLLEYGRAAEKHAKRPRSEDHEQNERDGLAVHVLKRGGGPVAVRANWSMQPEERLRQLSEWIESRSISGRVAYDLQKLADVYESWPASTVKDAIQRDALSMMTGKQPPGASKMSEIKALIKAQVVGATSLRSLANDLLIARQIATALGQSSFDSPGDSHDVEDPQ
jgi:CRISPR-associated protein Cmr2